MRNALFAAVILAFAAGCDRADPDADTAAPSSPATVPGQPVTTPSSATSMPESQSQPQRNTAKATLEPTQGNRARGELLLSPDNYGLRITGEITGLKANAEHGFHVHERGDCSAPDANSAGEHFNPAGQPHGRPNGQPHHAGDMMNLVADAQGNAQVDIRLEHATLGDGGDNDIMNRALVVHADPDDYTSQPAGNSGARIACGVISPPAPPPAPADTQDATEDDDQR